jgi:hypothetical protein
MPLTSTASHPESKCGALELFFLTVASRNNRAWGGKTKSEEPVFFRLTDLVFSLPKGEQPPRKGISGDLRGADIPDALSG